MLINKPHALYCNGELIGIITNPDPIGIHTLFDLLNNDDEHSDKIDLVTMPHDPLKWVKICEALYQAGVKDEIVQECTDEECAAQDGLDGNSDSFSEFDERY